MTLFHALECNQVSREGWTKANRDVVSIHSAIMARSSACRVTTDCSRFSTSSFPPVSMGDVAFKRKDASILGLSRVEARETIKIIQSMEGGNETQGQARFICCHPTMYLYGWTSCGLQWLVKDRRTSTTTMGKGISHSNRNGESELFCVYILPCCCYRPKFCWNLSVCDPDPS